jgi:dolichyl-phosphate beta-glucosyltransferase
MSTAEDPPFLSLVIPAFNEAARLPGTLDTLSAYLSAQHYAAEVLVIDDGSTDGTAACARARADKWPALRLICAPHRGKGHAIKLGMLAAAGQYVFLCDADLAMPITELAKLLPGPGQDVEIAIGSREGVGAHRYDEPLYRHLMGRAFNLLVRWLVLPEIQDSQCGFKCLRGDLAHRLAEIQTIDGWGFDVELLYAARLWGAYIVEVPIAWYYVPSSRIHPVLDSWRMTRDVLRVRLNAHRGVYASRPLPAQASAAMRRAP